MSRQSIKTIFAVLTLAAAGATHAATITPGFTFAVASDGGPGVTGSHFHSNTGGSFGNPAGKAEVGRFSTEEVRGLSEYDLTGLGNATNAFVTFNVFSAGGLFQGTNDFPFTGNIRIQAYAGNNTEDLSDFEAASIGTVGNFSTAPLSVGDILSFDITSIFNAAIANADISLGIRLAAFPLNTNGGAWTFDTFRLTSDDQSTNPRVIPVPASLPLMLGGLMLIGYRSLRRRG